MPQDSEYPARIVKGVAYKKWPRKRLVRSGLCAAALAMLLLFDAVMASSGLAGSRSTAGYFPAAVASATFYVSPTGNDSNSGHSPEQAWRTIARVNQADFNPGSTILFEGGQSFTGSIFLNEADCRGGTADMITSVSSYGNGQATIAALNDRGIQVANCDYVRISNMTLTGSGPENLNIGVDIVNILPGGIALAGVEIMGLHVSGFRHGIRVRAANGLSGFSELSITNNEVHHNTHTGISTSWDVLDYEQTGWPFSEVYIAHNTVHDILGDPLFTSSHTGSGIVAGSVQNALIEHNTVFSNGVMNAGVGGGPIGIWAWDCSATVIQFNESRDNHSGTPLDGGGFDLDGGCQDSIMQYNFSHDNDGAGFMAGQFAAARAMNGITIRYNLSVNDARRNRYGGIHLFTAPGTRLQGVDIYQNTVFIAPGKSTSSAFGVSQWAPGLRDVRVINNSFIADDGVRFIDIEDVGNGIQFLGNNYDSTADAFVIHFEGNTYTSLPDWRAATGQERLGELSVGSAKTADVIRPGGDSPEDYQLRADSVLVDAGLDLLNVFGLVAGARDFFGNPVPAGKSYDIGMHELPRQSPPTSTPMPMDKHTSFLPVLTASFSEG